MDQGGGGTRLGGCALVTVGFHSEAARHSRRVQKQTWDPPDRKAVPTIFVKVKTLTTFSALQDSVPCWREHPMASGKSGLPREKGVEQKAR